MHRVHSLLTVHRHAGTGRAATHPVCHVACKATRVTARTCAWPMCMALRSMRLTRLMLLEFFIAHNLFCIFPVACYASNVLFWWKDKRVRLRDHSCSCPQMTATKRALTSHTASISGLAFLLLWAVSLTSRATAQTAASPEATVVITNGAGFISALANDSVLSAVVLSSFSVTDSDFDAYPKAIERSTNLTISGNATAQTEWPVVGLGFVRGKVWDASACRLLLALTPGP